MKNGSAVRRGPSAMGKNTRKGTLNRTAGVGAAILHRMVRGCLTEKVTKFEGGAGVILQYLGEECPHSTNSQVQSAPRVCLTCSKTSKETSETEAE